MRSPAAHSCRGTTGTGTEFCRRERGVRWQLWRDWAQRWRLLAESTRWKRRSYSQLICCTSCSRTSAGTGTGSETEERIKGQGTEKEGGTEGTGGERGTHYGRREIGAGQLEGVVVLCSE